VKTNWKLYWVISHNYLFKSPLSKNGHFGGRTATQESWRGLFQPLAHSSGASKWPSLVLPVLLPLPGGALVSTFKSNAGPLLQWRRGQGLWSATETWTSAWSKIRGSDPLPHLTYCSTWGRSEVSPGKQGKGASLLPLLWCHHWSFRWHSRPIGHQEIPQKSSGARSAYTHFPVSAEGRYYPVLGGK